LFARPVHSLFLRFDEAEAAFSRAIAISPSLHQAHLYCALMRLIFGRAGDAIEPMRLAFKFGSQDLHPGMMLMNCQGALRLDEERKATARLVWRLAQRRITLNPYDDQAAYVGAFALDILGQKTEAIRWARVAAGFNIEDARSTYNIACLFSVLGEVHDAISFLRKTLEFGVPEVKRNWILHHDSDWDKLRDTPAFRMLFQRA